jgi:Asp-tRNA(Asn)/Glu-tRNA(Gln) amidotransferase A subunit family amidase
VKDITLQPAVDLLAMLRSNAISPMELADEFIQQIQSLNPQINAFVHFDPDRIREEVRQAERTVTGRGPLYGLPMSVKASIATAGYRCETGSTLNRGHTPAEDALAVSRMRRAGATILGTTNCPEFLMAYETENRLYGRTSNPWNLDYTAGGSSGGESAAIAAGLSSCGLGSDSGGSVREPAHFTGICSLKPTPGRIPVSGHLAGSAGPFSILGAIGPMARTVKDVQLLFDVLSGHDDADPIGAPTPRRSPNLDELKQYPVGVFQDDGLIPVTPETRAAVRDAAKALEGQGFHVRRYRPKSLEEARQLWWKFFIRCGLMLLEPLVQGREAELSPTFRGYLEIARRDGPLSGDELLQAWCECDVVRARLLEEMREYPILLCPVCAIPAFRHGERSWTVEGQAIEYLDAMRYTVWFNLLASPAAVVPVGTSLEGLPIGVQIAGRPYEDEIVLGVAAAIESEFGYTPPPIAIQS